MAPSYRQQARSGLSQEPPHYAFGSPSLLADADPDPKPTRPSKAQIAEWEGLYQHLESRLQALYTWRVGTWTTWAQIARYMKPYRYYAFIVDNVYNKGLREDFAIVDRTATLAGEICAAGMMATLTDPDRPWLQLGPAIPNFELDREGKRYYEDLTERLNYVYEHSNFYDAQAQQYDDLTFFGNGVVVDYEDAQTILNCVTPCAGEYMIGVNFEFQSETLYREYKMTVSQMVEMFGVERCPPDVQQMWRQKGGALEYERVIGHAIEPNFPIAGAEGSGQPSVGVVPGGFTWREVYWIRGVKNAKPLSMTGFHEQPFATSRWATQGNDAYGRGVGENMLGDTIQLQLETRQKAESIEKVNRPPMGADVALMNQPASTSPGKITYMNTSNGGEKKFFPLYEVKPDIPAITADIGIIQDRIRQTAYNDVFQRLMTLRQQMKLKADMTATEVEQLTEEALLRLGPMIGRIYGSMRIRVKRHVAILERKGLMPRKPDSLRRVPLRIGFDSLLSEARRAVKTQAIARTMQFAGTLEGVWPESRYKINAEVALEKFAAGVGAPPEMVRTEDEVKALLAKQEQRQQMAALIEQSKTGAAAAAALSKTSLAPGNALSALVQPPQ